MSADNYFLIRKADDKFVVSMGFASDEHAPAIRPDDPRFNTLEAALVYGQGEYSEYGVRVDFESVGERPCLVDTLRADVVRLTAERDAARAESSAHQTARVAAEEFRDNLAQLASDVLAFLDDRRRGDPPTTREDHADEDSAVALLRAAVRTRETPSGEDKA